MINLTVHFLLKSIGLLLGICFVLIINLMIRRKIEQRKINAIEKYIQKTKMLWYQYFLNDGAFTTKFVPKSKSDIEAIERIFLSYLKNISNQTVQIKIKYFAAAYLQSHYSKELKSRNWSRRLSAMYRIADFQLDNLITICEERKKKCKLTPEERFQLIKLKSMFQKDEFITSLVTTEEVFSENEYKQLFAILDEELLVQLLEKENFINNYALYALIETIAASRYFIFIDELEKMLQNNDSEIRIRAIKALENIGVIKQLDKYIPFVYSSLWEERLMIAKLFKHLPLSYTYEYLEILLKDENWWVRSQAANTILDDPLGVQKLKKFIQMSDDKYAIDMAKEVLMKRLEAI